MFRGPQYRLSLGIFILAFAFHLYGDDTGSHSSCDLDSTPKLNEITGSSWCSLLQRGFALNRAYKPTEAARLFRAVVEKSKREGNWFAEAHAHRGLGESYSNTGDDKSAKPELETARAEFEQHHDTHGMAQADLALGTVLFFVSGRNEAMKTYEKAAAEFRSAADEHGWLHAQLGRTWAYTGPKAITPELLKLEALARKLHDNIALSESLHWQGDEQFGLGDFSAALKKYQEAIAVAEQPGAGGDLPGILVSLGRLERAHGAPEAALPYYRRALRIKNDRGDEAGAVRVMIPMAVAYEDMNRTDKAVRIYQRAIPLARASGATHLVTFLLGNLASDYEDQGRVQKAIAILRSVIQTEKNDYLLGYRYEALARCYYKMHRPRQALIEMDKAIRFIRSGGEREYLVTALTLRARIFMQLDKMAKAQKDSDEITAILEEIRSHSIASDYLKRGLAEESREAYDIAIQIAVRQKNFRRAAELGEQGRARAFLDLLATRQANPAASSAPAASPVNNADPRRIIRDSTIVAQSFTADQMIATAKKLNSTIVSYWSSEDRLFIFVISPAGTISEKTRSITRRQLTSLVSETHPRSVLLPLHPRRRQGPARRDIWHELYSVLIAPIELDLPRRRDSLLTIVPHGPLFELPFEALRDSHSHYLVERYAIDYLPAVAVFAFTEQNGHVARDRPAKALLVAPQFGTRAGSPDEERRASLVDLPAASTEVKSIRSLLPAPVTLDTPGLTSEALMTTMREATLIHFATHAVLDNKSALSSYIVLGAGREPGGAAENKLTVDQIYGLKLSSDLVVLSACRTARGKITGDGVLGLTRAFFAAGAASVIASVWGVPDVTTERLMVDFYGNLKHGLSKSESLRRAQLELIRDLRENKISIGSGPGAFKIPEDPQFWAGFVLQGNP